MRITFAINILVSVFKFYYHPQEYIQSYTTYLLIYTNTTMGVPECNIFEAESKRTHLH